MTFQLDRAAFFDAVRNDPFPGHLSDEQVAGMTRLLDELEARWERGEWLDRDWPSYTFATSYHETGGRMQPVREGFASSNAGAIRAVTNLYRRGRISRNYARPDASGFSWYGRGDVQLTWRDNYVKMTTHLNRMGYNVDLTKNPDDALDPKISALILFEGMEHGLYSGPSLGDFFNARRDDPLTARRIVNGRDKARKISGYHSAFEAAFIAGGMPDLAARKKAKPSRPLPAESTDSPILRHDDEGEGVLRLQRLLNAWRNDRGLPLINEDGDFGPETMNAVTQFQEASAAYTKPVDGVVGPATWDALRADTDEDAPDVPEALVNIVMAAGEAPVSDEPVADIEPSLTNDDPGPRKRFGIRELLALFLAGAAVIIGIAITKFSGV